LRSSVKSLASSAVVIGVSPLLRQASTTEALASSPTTPSPST
jgi:hypothetical protein